LGIFVSFDKEAAINPLVASFWRFAGVLFLLAGCMFTGPLRSLRLTAYQ
jgi:hypothetical protein